MSFIKDFKWIQDLMIWLSTRKYTQINCGRKSKSTPQNVLFRSNYCLQYLPCTLITWTRWIFWMVISTNVSEFHPKKHHPKEKQNFVCVLVVCECHADPIHFGLKRKQSSLLTTCVSFTFLHNAWDVESHTIEWRSRKNSHFMANIVKLEGNGCK